MFCHLSLPPYSLFHSLIVTLLVWSIWINHQSLLWFLFPSLSLVLPPPLHPTRFRYITGNLYSRRIHLAQWRLNKCVCQTQMAWSPCCKGTKGGVTETLAEEEWLKTEEEHQKSRYLWCGKKQRGQPMVKECEITDAASWLQWLSMYMYTQLFFMSWQLFSWVLYNKIHSESEVAYSLLWPTHYLIW